MTLALSIEQVVFYAVFVVWLVFTFMIERVLTGKEHVKPARTQEDRGSSLLIYFSVFVAIVVAFGLGGVGVTPLPGWVFGIGIFLMLFGIFVREWAVLTLKDYFLFRVGVLDGHKVVDYGPYRLVRHPGYAGSILTMIGIGLAVESLAAALILALLCGIAYGYRIRVEEVALSKELGEEYSKYMSRTKRLIPFIF